jgi:RsiW-degrading membrane proteinase PrsW (M82 family)
VLLAAVAPGLALLAYFYLKDRYQAEPIKLVMKMFIYGAIIMFPIMALQSELIKELGKGTDFTFSFILSAGLEEFFKWFILYHLIYRHAEFDEPYDGIVYAVAVSLGFATLENVLYAFVHTTSFSELLIRAMLPVSGHALFGVIMGFYLGKAKFMPSKAQTYLWFSMLFPIFWHGLFNYILLISKTYWIWFMIPFMTFLWIRALWKVDKANSRSPLRVMHHEDKINLN